jgi:predicted nucleic acid-binding protein
MKTAVDSNVLFDLLSGDEGPAVAARRALVAASEAGPMVVCPVVYTEVSAAFAGQQELVRFLGDADLALEAFSEDALRASGEAWVRYARRRAPRLRCTRRGNEMGLRCTSCGMEVAWRQHVMSDFLIGGHAMIQADQLITRDRGYYRTYFPRLTLVVPGAGVD